MFKILNFWIIGNQENHYIVVLLQGFFLHYNICDYSNKLQIYSSCSEAYRLSASGELHVPPETTDEYCTGPCISETHHVLDCLENLLQQFKFYNKATIYDVRETIKAGCSHGPQRGDSSLFENIIKNTLYIFTSCQFFFHCYVMITLLGH